MANPMGTNQFADDPQYGDVSKHMQLSREAPISGAPLPGSATNTRPVGPNAPAPLGPGVMAQGYANPPEGLAYYKALAKTWARLAAVSGHPLVQEHATNARQYAKRVERGEV